MIILLICLLSSSPVDLTDLVPVTLLCSAPPDFALALHTKNKHVATAVNRCSACCISLKCELVSSLIGSSSFFQNFAGLIIFCSTVLLYDKGSAGPWWFWI